MKYNEIIPILVNAVQQQNIMMQSKNSEITELKEDVADIKKLLLEVGTYAGMDLTFEKLNEASVLYQNHQTLLMKIPLLNMNYHKFIILPQL